MSRGGMCWDPSGTHSKEIAARQAPGPGHAMRQVAWCCMCDQMQPVLGSTFRGQLRVCGGCKRRPAGQGAH